MFMQTLSVWFAMNSTWRNQYYVIKGEDTTHCLLQAIVSYHTCLNFRMLDDYIPQSQSDLIKAYVQSTQIQSNGLEAYHDATYKPFHSLTTRR